MRELRPRWTGRRSRDLALDPRRAFGVRMIVRVQTPETLLLFHHVESVCCCTEAHHEDATERRERAYTTVTVSPRSSRQRWSLKANVFQHHPPPATDSARQRSTDLVAGGCTGVVGGYRVDEVSLTAWVAEDTRSSATDLHDLTPVQGPSNDYAFEKLRDPLCGYCIDISLISPRPAQCR